MDQFWSHLGPFGPSWAYLGTLFGPVLGYLGLLEAILGASWDQELFGNLRPDLPVGGARGIGPFLFQFWGSKLATFWLFLVSCFGQVFEHFLEYCWANFGYPFWQQMGLRGAKMGSKRPIKSFKVAKTCICKNLRKYYVFTLFLRLPRPCKTALGGPRRLPKGA